MRLICWVTWPPTAVMSWSAAALCPGWARTITESIRGAACTAVANVLAVRSATAPAAIAVTVRRLRSSQLIPCTGAIPWQPPGYVPCFPAPLVPALDLSWFEGYGGSGSGGIRRDRSVTGLSEVVGVDRMCDGRRVQVDPGIVGPAARRAPARLAARRWRGTDPRGASRDPASFGVNSSVGMRTASLLNASAVLLWWGEHPLHTSLCLASFRLPARTLRFLMA